MATESGGGEFWIPLVITNVATFLASVTGAVFAARIQIAPLLKDAKDRRRGYAQRTINELSEFRDRIDEHYADVHAGETNVIFYWDLSDPSVFSTEQDWAVTEDSERNIEFRASLRGLRDFLRPIQKVEKIEAAQLPELLEKLGHASRCCGAVIDALEARQTNG